MEQDKNSVFDDELVRDDNPAGGEGADVVAPLPDGGASAVPDTDAGVDGTYSATGGASAESDGEESDGEVDETDGETDTGDAGARNGSGGRSGLRSFFSSLKSALMFILSMLNPKNLFSGKMIPVDFVLNKWKTLLVVFCLLMFYISNRYSCQQKEERIGSLRKEVEELRYKSLDMFVRLKRIQKEEAVLMQVRDSALDLHYPDRPPYIILDKENGSE